MASQLSNSISIPIRALAVGASKAPRHSAVVRLDPEPGLAPGSYRVTLGPVGFNGVPLIADPSGTNSNPDVDWHYAPCFATVSWGRGAAQFIAEVDWPPQGCSFVLTADAINISVNAEAPTLTGGSTTTEGQLIFSASITPAAAESIPPAQPPVRTMLCGQLAAAAVVYLAIPACARDWKLNLMDGISTDPCKVTVFSDAICTRKIQVVDTGELVGAIAQFPVQEWPRQPLAAPAMIWSLQNGAGSASSLFSVEFGLDFG